MRTIGFAGTAKNTGKTTTALSVADRCRAAGRRLALTSIGYDGELQDNITGLPKPRYFLRRGDWVATAEKCLRHGNAGYRIYHKTGVHSILGKIVLAEVTDPGVVVLAGANRRSDLKLVLNLFADIGIDITLVDGALNRLIPMICVDGLVLSTGAAFDERIPVIVTHVHTLCQLLRLPWIHWQAKQPAHIQIEMAGKPTRHLTASSLLGETACSAVEAAITAPVRRMIIPNACDPAFMLKLIKKYPTQLASTHWIVGDPLKLIASGDSRYWQELFARNNLHIQCLETVPLLLLTINPFFPCYNPSSDHYEAEMIDGANLLESIRQRVDNLPVIDLHQSPEFDLLSALDLNP